VLGEPKPSCGEENVAAEGKRNWHQHVRRRIERAWRNHIEGRKGASQHELHPTNEALAFLFAQANEGGNTSRDVDGIWLFTQVREQTLRQYGAQRIQHGHGCITSWHTRDATAMAHPPSAAASKKKPREV
jgi:hypothetical protein